jgi:hypothetical protein
MIRNLIFFIFFQSTFSLKCTTTNPSTRVITVQKNSSVSLFCQSSHQHVVVSSPVNLTFMNYSYVSNMTVQPLVYSAPSNDAGAFFESGRLVKCSSEHESCFFQLNVQFDPFIDKNVQLVQELIENEPGVIECPIRAPNIPYHRYMLIWSGPNENASLSQNFTLNSYFYHVKKVDYFLNNKIFKCALYKNNVLLYEESILVHVVKSHSYYLFIFGFCMLLVISRLVWAGPPPLPPARAVRFQRFRINF